MFVLKGFVEIQPFIDNNPTQDSNLGEISTYSKTYTRDIGYYSNNVSKDVRLLTFASKDIEVVDAKEVNTPRKAPQDIANRILEISQWLFQRSNAGAITSEPTQVVEAILHQFSLYIQDLKIGNVLKLNNQTADIYLPEYIRFSLRGYGEDTDIQVWYSDQSFRDQYPYSEIQVVSPIPNVDDFFSATVVVKAHLEQLTPMLRQQRIQEAHDNKPSTIVKIEAFDYFSPHDEITYTTYWGVIIYGQAGDNPDSIKEAINDHIFANTNRPREDWLPILPDIFRRTEFILVPMWENFSIPNETLMRGIYSPTLKLDQLSQIIEKGTYDYPLEHVEVNSEATVFFYRSIPVLACGGFENRDGIYSLKTIFPDYFVISTGDTEYSRMSPKTREWMETMSNLIRHAEDATDYTGLPKGVAKVKRGPYLYLSSTFDDRQYLVLTQYSYINMLKPQLK